VREELQPQLAVKLLQASRLQTGVEGFHPHSYPQIVELTDGAPEPLARV
jgi:hypothetical protein